MQLVDSTRVWVRSLGNACRVRVEGTENARWLVNRLAETPALAGLEFVDVEGSGTTCTFRVPNSAERTLATMEKELADIPGVVLRVPEARQNRRTLLEFLDGLLHGAAPLLDKPAAYMSGVLERFPNWSRRVESLRWQGVNCWLALQELRRRVSRSTPFRLHQQIHDDLREWMGSFRNHRRNESKLLQTAMSPDIGGEA
jgi:hypothetical protein